MTERINLTEEMLNDLREDIKNCMDSRRYNHTMGVEREADALGKLFLPHDRERLRGAALLHDITKRLDIEKQLKICEDFGIMTDNSLKASPKLFHARTAAAIAGRDHARYADEEILSAVRWHTTGRAGMTLFESLIYLADYIEDTRTFEDCVILRRFFYTEIEKAENEEEKREVLRKTMVRSFDMTIKNLIEEGSPIDRDTVEARNYFIENKPESK